MGTIKDRYTVDLTKGDGIKNKQEYREELYRKKKKKKSINDMENYDGMVTHLEPDILEYEVKWVLGSITTNKACEGDRSLH